MLGCWPNDAAAGYIAQNLSGKTGTALERLVNGGFETAGAGGADIWDIWTERASDGALADEVSIIYGGGHSAKMTAGAGLDTWVNSASIPVIPGETLTINLWAYGDGTHSGRYAIYNETTSSYIQALTSIGTADASWTNKILTQVIPANCAGVKIYLACPATAAAVVYFDDVSVKGSINTCQGVYVGSLTYRRPGPVSGTYGVTFPGATLGAISLGNPTFNSFWNGDLFSFISWGKVANAGVWTDLSTHRYLFHVKSYNDATYYAVMGRNLDAINQIRWLRRVGAAYTARTYTFGTPPLGWFCMGYSIDISASGNEKCYLYVPGAIAWTKVYDGVISGGNGAWGAHPVTDNNALLFGGSPTAQLWQGDGGLSACWTGCTLTDTEMKRVMVL